MTESVNDSTFQSSTKSFRSSTHYASRLIIVGSILYVASIFLPWSATSLMYEFLPFSPLLNFGLPPVAVPSTSYFLSVSIIVRAAAIIMWVGIILQEIVNKPRIIHLVTLIAGFISLIAFGMFAFTRLSLSWGAYLSLLGGLIVVLSVILDMLEIEK